MPAKAVGDGKLQVQFRVEAQVNVVVSVIELWSTAPSPTVLHLSGAAGMMTDLEGRVLNLAYDGQGDIDLMLAGSEENKPLATTRSSSDGQFHFARHTFEHVDRSTELRVVATRDNITAEKGRRIILRFDAIHAGTQYWLNGKLLGASENLFTPVEWDVTDSVRLDAANRLDLKMIVATASERLSSSSGYTGHSLGGIDAVLRSPAG